MATKNASVPSAFLAVIASLIMVGLGWLSDPPTADQTGILSGLLAWFCLGAAAIAVIAAIFLTCRAITIREPQKEPDLEFEGNGSGESPGPNSLRK